MSVNLKRAAKLLDLARLMDDAGVQVPPADATLDILALYYRDGIISHDEMVAAIQADMQRAIHKAMEGDLVPYTDEGFSPLMRSMSRVIAERQAALWETVQEMYAGVSVIGLVDV